METKHITNTVHDSKISLSNNAEAKKNSFVTKIERKHCCRHFVGIYFCMYLNSVELII